MPSHRHQQKNRNRNEKIKFEIMSSDNESNQQIKLQSLYPWIDNRLFEEMLRIDFPAEKIVIQSYALRAALANGENYSSQMIRVKVNYLLNGESKEIKLIIKAATAEEGLDEKMANERKELFYKEIAAYDEVLTKVHNLLKGIGDKTKLHGRCYATNREKGYLIFEDLSDAGFKNVDRRAGLDIPHYKLVLSILAKYHAATAVLVEKEPSIKKLFNEHGTVTGAGFLRKMITNFVIAQRDFCKTQPGLEKLVEKFTNIENTLYDRICATSVRDDNDFNVILHGDLWSNNIMFKYDANGAVEDTVLVDFQICYYGPPALDVTYCLYTSSHNGVGELDWDMLVQHYYDELRTTLKKMNYTKRLPTLMEFNAQMIMRGMYGASTGIVCEAGRMLENVGEDGLSNFVADDAAEYRLNMLLNPKVAPKIVKLLKYFDRKGYYESDDVQK